MQTYLSITRVLMLAGLIMVFAGAGCNWFSRASTTYAPGSTGGVATTTTPSPTTTGRIPTQAPGQPSDPFSSAANVRVTLNTLLNQHVALLSSAARASISSRPDFEGATHALDDNSQQLSQVVGTLYGQSAQPVFLQSWRSHIDAALEYASTSRRGDKNALAALGQKLNDQSAQITTTLSKMGMTGADSLGDLFREHSRAIQAMMDAYAAKNYQDAFTKQAQAMTQGGRLADAMTRLMIAQFPQRFTS